MKKYLLEKLGKATLLMLLKFVRLKVIFLVKLCNENRKEKVRPEQNNKSKKRYKTGKKGNLNKPK